MRWSNLRIAPRISHIKDNIRNHTEHIRNNWRTIGAMGAEQVLQRVLGDHSRIRPEFKFDNAFSEIVRFQSQTN